MNYSRNFTFFILVIMIFLSNNCQSQKFARETQNDHLPDLKFDTIHFEYLKRSQPPSKPGKPRRNVIYPPYAIRFNISISNIGSEDWNHDLQILYIFDEQTTVELEPFVIKDLIIPYASMEDVELELKYPSSKPNSVTFFLNTTKIDSLEYFNIYDEFYYRNNSIKVNLN